MNIHLVSAISFKDLKGQMKRKAKGIYKTIKREFVHLTKFSEG